MRKVYMVMNDKTSFKVM